MPTIRKVPTHYVIRFQKLKFTGAWDELSFPYGNSGVGVFHYDITRAGAVVQVCYETPQGFVYTVRITGSQRRILPGRPNPNPTAWVMGDVLHVYGIGDPPAKGDLIN